MTADAPPPPEVVLYGRAGCPPCDEAREALRRLRRGTPFALAERDVDADPALARRYGDRVPVVTVGGREAAAGRVAAADLRRALEDAARGARG